MSPDERAKSAYRKWYDKNRETHNERRRQAYASDPKLREKALEKQREYRATERGNNGDGKHFRKVGNKKVEVFRIGTVAEIVGRDIQVLRLWEKKGRIPKPTIKSAQRFYTQRQVDLIQEFVQLMDEVRYQRNTREEALSKKTAEIKAQWAGVSK